MPGPSQPGTREVVDHGIVVATTGSAGHVVVGKPDVRPSLARVLVDTGDLGSWWEVDVVDAGIKGLWAGTNHAIIVVVTVVPDARPKSIVHRPGRAVSLPRVMPSSTAGLEGVLRMAARPESAMCRPGVAIVLDMAAKLRVGAMTPFGALIP